MTWLRHLRRLATSEWLRPYPVEAECVVPSLLCTLSDDPARPSERLLDLALNAAQAARHLSLAPLASRAREAGYPLAVDAWPGEYYRLLAGIVRVMQPRLVIELGTFRGLGALAMASEMPADGRVVTYDIVPWHQVRRTCLQESDFQPGRLEQRVADLSDAAVCRAHADLLAQADLIFLDAEKDGAQEVRFIRNLEAIPFVRPPVLVFDDIRLWNMLKIWRDLPYPKLDLTSFGHWSGTGLVDFQIPRSAA